MWSCMDRRHCCGWKQKTFPLLVFTETPTGKPISQACKRTVGFLISNFRRVLYVVFFLLGNSLASEFYMPMFRNTLSFFTYLPMKMDQTECSETSAYKIQTLRNYPEENIQRTVGCWNDKPLGYPMLQQLLHTNIFMLHWSVMQLKLTVQKLHQKSRKCMVVTYQYLAVHVNILFETMVHQIRKKSSALYVGMCNSHTIFKTNNP